MKRKYLRRYTTLPFLFDILNRKKLTLLNPNTWEDQNDSYFIELYKERTNKESVFALCFSETNETFHHWKIYSGNSAGVCIQFKKSDLIKCFESIGSIKHGKVLYKTVAQLDKEIFENKLTVENLPFLKRHAFRDELEYRFLYINELKDTNVISRKINSIDVEIKLESISKIILNPWMPYFVCKSITEVLHSIDGCKNIKVIQTALVDNMEWKSFGANISLSTKTQHSSWGHKELSTDPE